MRAHAAGRCRFTHISFGVVISGDITPPTWSSTRWRVAVHSSASASARWSIHTIVSQRSPPLGAAPTWSSPLGAAPTWSSPLSETPTCSPLRPRNTVEQVASKEMPTTSSAATLASERAARMASQAAAQMFSESCS